MTKAFETPHFETENEEAEWWDSHQDEVLAAFEEAAKNGTLGRGTVMKHGLKAFEMLTSGEPLAPEAKAKSAA